VHLLRAHCTMSLSALLMAVAHLGGFVYVAFPSPVAVPVWPRELVVQHQLVGIASALGVFGALLAVLRVVSQRDVALVALAVQVAWLPLAYKWSAVLSPLVQNVFQLGLGVNFIYLIHTVCALAAFNAFVQARRWTELSTRGWFSFLLLLLIAVTHLFAVVSDTQALVQPGFLRNGVPLHLPLLPSEQLAQVLVGICHLSGLFAAAFAMIGLITTRAAAACSFVTQATWALVMVLHAPAWEALLDARVLGYDAILGIHGVQSAVALLLFFLAPSAIAPPPAKAKRS